jgi:hypothetical protein
LAILGIAASLDVLFRLTRTAGRSNTKEGISSSQEIARQRFGEQSYEQRIFGYSIPHPMHAIMPILTLTLGPLQLTILIRGRHLA